MNGNNEVKKLLLVVLVDIEILFKNDVYKNYSDNLKSIKKNIENVKDQIKSINYINDNEEMNYYIMILKNYIS